jgi:hypothetical protein
MRTRTAACKEGNGDFLEHVLGRTMGIMSPLLGRLRNLGAAPVDRNR